MRLTADLINNSLSYLNPLKERELDLRGKSSTEKSRYLQLFCYYCYYVFLPTSEASIAHN